MVFKHLANAGMSYWSHFKFSMSLSKEFAKASVAASMHAIVPDIFVSHSRDTITRLRKKFEERKG